MKRKFVIHAGLHKTGSTSIQFTLTQHKVPQIAYPDLGVPNQSNPLSYAFPIGPHSRDGSVPDRLRLTPSQIVQAVEAAEGETVVISAESMAAPNRMIDLVAMRKALEPFASEFAVIAYVRAPLSTVSSEAQQLIKGMHTTDAFPPIVYRNKIAPLDQTFGRDAVELVTFDRSCLAEGDVVIDFYRRLGVELPSEKVVRKNDSISREMAALVFAHSAHGLPKNRRAKYQKRLIAGALSNFGGTRFRIGDAMARRLLTQSAGEISWIENRMGIQFSEDPADLAGGVEGPEDLYSLAAANGAAFCSELRQLGPRFPGDIDSFERALQAISAKPGGLDYAVAVYDAAVSSIQVRKRPAPQNSKTNPDANEREKRRAARRQERVAQRQAARAARRAGR